MAKCLHDRVRSSCSICKPEQVFKSYQRKARERNLRFELTLEEFEKIVQQPCVFCGEQAEPRGLDRRDNHIAYFIWNVQSACGPCNMLKKDLDQFKFLLIVQRIANYQALRKKAA